jgi:hypothetical protein
MRSGCKFAVLALIVGAAFFLTTSAAAQMNGFSTTNFGGATIHGVPPSVTSFGFGGTPGFHGVPPSVTSLNFGSLPFHPSRSGGFVAGPFRTHRRHHRGFSPLFYGGYYVPYAYDYSDYEDPGYFILNPGPDDSMERDYRGGPTIFDRRGSGEYPSSRSRSSDDYRAELDAAQPPASAPTQPVADQPETVLIFKDGHKIEVQNYAIVGPTLYDLSSGRTRKMALAELDLPATMKQNDERGVSFQLPMGTKLN